MTFVRPGTEECFGGVYQESLIVRKKIFVKDMVFRFGSHSSLLGDKSKGFIKLRREDDENCTICKEFFRG